VGLGDAVLVARTTAGVIVGVAVMVGAGEGEDVRVAPLGAVGVAYCPHRDAFPAQEASKKDAAIRKLVSRFTKESAAENYTCRRGGARQPFDAHAYREI
jgi:hypothetical protein